MNESIPTRRRLSVLFAAGSIVVLCLIAYSNSFSGPFVFDDLPAILENPSILHLSKMAQVLSPPNGGTTESGRPILNLTLAINRALGGESVVGYHVFNLAIHIAAGLVLFGLMRRIFGKKKLVQAWAVALLWALHPLQTESVTYVIQRAESLMGLFYLVTVYAFARGASGEGKGWLVLSWAACLLGMGTKEVMASAPVIVLLYDRTFVSQTFREAWRLRRGYYLALASTWIFLGIVLVRSGGNRGGTVGFHTGISWTAYALTQFKALAHYLQLTVWPSPLVFEYGTYWIHSAADVLPYALLVLGLLGASAYALFRRSWKTSPFKGLGFAGVSFFVILAPTSSVIPGISQMIVEHRMYLPLAAVIAVLVAGLDFILGRWSLVLFIVLAASLGFTTFHRNRDYRSELALWEDTVDKRPDNPWAQCNLGVALFDAGRTSEAIDHYQIALRLRPKDAEARYNLANARAQSGHVPEALRLFTEALQLAPDDAKAHCNYANTLVLAGRGAEAIAQFNDSLRLNPDSWKAHNDLGLALVAMGRTAEGITQYQAALQLRPTDPAIHYNLGSALALTGDLSAAIDCYQRALKIDPGYALAHNNLGNALARSGRLEEAVAEFEKAWVAKPDYAEAHFNCALAFEQLGRLSEAKRQLNDSLRLRPGFVPAAEALARLGGR